MHNIDKLRKIIKLLNELLSTCLQDHDKINFAISLLSLTLKNYTSSSQEDKVVWLTMAKDFINLELKNLLSDEEE